MVLSPYYNQLKIPSSYYPGCIPTYLTSLKNQKIWFWYRTLVLEEKQN
jgi:hypothetical protein